MVGGSGTWGKALMETKIQTADVLRDRPARTQTRAVKAVMGGLRGHLHRRSQNSIRPTLAGGCNERPLKHQIRNQPKLSYGPKHMCDIFFEVMWVQIHLPQRHWRRMCRVNDTWTRPLGGGGGHEAMVLVCLPLAAPIGLSPPLVLTLSGPERVLVVSMEPLHDLSYLTTLGVGRPRDGLVPVPLTRGIQMHTPSPCGGFADSSTALGVGEGAINAE